MGLQINQTLFDIAKQLINTGDGKLSDQLQRAGSSIVRIWQE
ncbi:MAG: hypothetical protein R3A45_10310 [Bdellovibrionota bacterium]